MWFIFILFLLVALGAGGLFARSYATGEPLLGNFFAPKPERRLAVVEQASVDGRRKLLLVRRDGVEHLIMTGGPVDVVIETGIGAAAAPRPLARATTRSYEVRSNEMRSNELQPTDDVIPASSLAGPLAGPKTTPSVFGRAARTLSHAVMNTSPDKAVNE